ncbi:MULTISPECIES: hypothetical protein [unclassified Clostridium]|uniref:hypothetical protein n=1 Tax=unclassified Clostridium TaxID=2614128 RepID=UPI002079FFC2|nr:MULTISPECIES: hypothetical protein [unclassified Clostridium]
MDIREFSLLEHNSVSVNWEKVEVELGFVICQDVKDFFSRIAGGYIKEIVDFKENYFFNTTGIYEYDHWISFNECEGEIELSLITPKSEDNIENFIINAFREWTGGNDFGHRVLLGDFEFNIGGVLILINNDSGKVEWIDCGYGYFHIYEENPNGVVANSLQEFLDKCVDKRLDD